MAAKKKYPLWTPPASAVIAPLEEQLAKIGEDAPRFVVVEKGYATYNEQGYIVYDRQEKKYYDTPHSYNGWNGVTRLREEAEKEAEYLQENPPIEEDDDDDDFFSELFSEDPDRPTFPSSMDPEPTKQPELEAIFVTNRKHIAGETIDDDGHTYIVMEPSWHISDVADLEDQDVFGIRAGWQTKAKLQ